MLYVLLRSIQLVLGGISTFLSLIEVEATFECLNGIHRELPGFVYAYSVFFWGLIAALAFLWMVNSNPGYENTQTGHDQ